MAWESLKEKDIRSNLFIFIFATSNNQPPTYQYYPMARTKQPPRNFPTSNNIPKRKICAMTATPFNKVDEGSDEVEMTDEGSSDVEIIDEGGDCSCCDSEEEGSEMGESGSTGAQVSRMSHFQHYN